MSLILDLNEVKIRADNAFKVDVEDARLMYQQYIMDWTDYHNETKDNRESNENKEIVDKITQVWLLAANMEISLKQYKKATVIFDNALNDEIAKNSILLYEAYADYYKTRNKPAKAQDVYIKGICCDSITQEDADKLWISLLLLIRENDGYITMKELYEEVEGTIRKELESNNDNSNTNVPLKAPSHHILEDVRYNRSISDRSTSTTYTDNNHDDIGINESKTDTILSLPPPSSSSSSTTTTTSKKFESKPLIIATTSVYDEWDNILGLTPEILRRIHHVRAPMLFSAPDQEPMSYGLNCINDDEVHELDTYLETRLRTLDRSKLSNTNNDDEKIRNVLDVLEALWTIQALKEKQFESWFNDLNSRHEKEGSDLNRNLMEREAKGDTRTSIDRKRFHNRCSVQKEVLLSIVNKTLYSLLLDQCKVLNEIRFPRCSYDLIEKLETNNNRCLNSNDINTYDKDLIQTIYTLQRYCCALLSLRVNVCTSSSSMSSTLKRGYSDITNNDTNTNKRRKQDDNFQRVIPPPPVLTIPGYR